MQKQVKKGISIQMKLISIIIPIVLVIMVSFFSLARNVVLKVSKEKLQAQSDVYAEEISSWTNQIFAELQIYQDAIESGIFKDDEAILKYMETSVEKNEAYPYGIYMGDDKGVYLDGSGWEPGDDWVLTERDWYVEGKENEILTFGEPYYDSMTGQVCVSASVLVDYKKATRVMASDVYLDYVADVITGISEQGEINGFLVTQDTQTIIAHADSEMMAVTLETEGIESLYNEIGTALSENENGILSIDGNYVCLSPVEHTDWYLVTYVAKKKVMADLQKMEWIMILIGIVVAILLTVGTLRVMGRVVKPVKKMTDVIDKIADGDFTQNLETKGNDEIARMSSNMQNFISQMRGTISEINDIATWLENQSVENGEVSESLKESSRKQSEEMELLEQMVEQLSTAAQDAAFQMEDLAQLVEKTDAEGKKADKLMKESIIMSNEGKKDMEQIHSGMGNINTSIMTLSEQVTKVSDIVAEIGNMVTMIMDIAEETNLLSLNASIEAARAGESGKGFSVVAEQIGKLAASSGAAADEISKLTTQISSTMEEAVHHMNASVREVQANVTVVSEAKATFADLYEKVDETGHRVEKMIMLVNKVDVVSGQMEEISRNQVQATEQIVQSTEELNRQTKIVTTDSNAVAESAEGLKKESVELMERMSRFQW